MDAIHAILFPRCQRITRMEVDGFTAQYRKEIHFVGLSNACAFFVFLDRISLSRYKGLSILLFSNSVEFYIFVD